MTGAKALSDCRPAPAGNFAEGTGNDGFTPCPGGTYQDKAGQGGCKPCPPGNECPAASVKPKQCRAGFFADLKQPFCRECPKGTFQDRPGQRACKPCRSRAGGGCRPAGQGGGAGSGLTSLTHVITSSAPPRPTPVSRHCRQLLPRQQDRQPHPLPCRHLQRQALRLGAHRMRQVPHQRECGGLGSAHSLPPPPCLSSLLQTPLPPAACPAHSTPSSSRPFRPPPPPVPRPAPQSFSGAAGSTTCRRCSAGQWTGRLTGQRSCWSTSRPLPGPAPSGRR